MGNMECVYFTHVMTSLFDHAISIEISYTIGELIELT